jgi:hypothetical protein
MAARANPFFDIASPAAAATADATGTPVTLAKFAALHEEAVETARLANLVGRAVHVAIALPVMAVLAAVLAGGAGLPSTIAWGILVAVSSLAIARAWAAAIQQPFERAVLSAFAKDVSACLLYAGFAWGAGAFLALGSGTSAVVALVYAGVPAALIALLLRERQAVLLFLAPVAALTAFACVLRPFAGGSFAAALVLIACAAVASVTIAAARRAAKRHDAALPHGLFAS